MKHFTILPFLICCSFWVQAEGPTDTLFQQLDLRGQNSQSADSLLSALQSEADSLFYQLQIKQDSVVRSLTFIEGEVALSPEIQLTIPSGCYFLSPEDTKKVLTDLWGNTPTPTLGMLTDKNEGLFGDSSFVLEIIQDANGPVKWEESDQLSPAVLKYRIEKEHELRREYMSDDAKATIDSIQWMLQPKLLKDQQQIYWAWKVYFHEQHAPLLNYHFRQLTSTGYVGINAVGEVSGLPLILKHQSEINQAFTLKTTLAYSSANWSEAAKDYRSIDELIASSHLEDAVSEAVTWKYVRIVAIGLLGLIIAFWSKIKTKKKS